MSNRSVNPTWPLRMLPSILLSVLIAGCGEAPDGPSSAATTRNALGTAPLPTLDPLLRPPITTWPPVSLAAAYRRFDVNGDGFKDLAVGSQTDRVYVFHGGAAGVPAAPSRVLQAPSGSNTVFGGSVDNAGDVNGDGYSDLIVGANDASVDMGLMRGGEAYLYLGGPSGVASTPAQTLRGIDVGGLAFGFKVANARDINRDGYDDVVVSAVASDNQRGKVFIFLGGAAGLNLTPAYTLLGSGDVDSNFGYDMVVTSLNKDLYPDLVVTENRSPFWGAVGVGRVLIYLGTSSGYAAAPSQVIEGPCGPQQGFGVSVSGVGDVNLDRYGDLLVGAYGVNGNSGRAYLFNGNASGVSATPSFIFTPPAGNTGGYLGWSLTGGGDLNNDGYADFAIGETDAAQTAGEVHVYYGPWIAVWPWGWPQNPLVVSVPDQTLAGTHVGKGFFGNALTIPGDLNGDGKADLVVAAPAADANAGRVYIFNGKTQALSGAASKTLYSPAAGAHFGQSINH